MSIDVEVKWRTSKGHWDSNRVLYAYLHPETDELLYVGKAYHRTVNERFHAVDKESFWEQLEDEYEIDAVNIIVGELQLQDGKRISEALVSDVESLLIYRHKPWGNIQSKRSRGISRPGMRVRCIGGWDGWKTAYRDR